MSDGHDMQPDDEMDEQENVEWLEQVHDDPEIPRYQWKDWCDALGLESRARMIASTVSWRIYIGRGTWDE